MAGRHIGKILKQPKRVHFRLSSLPPLAEFKFSRLVQTLADPSRKFVWQGHDVVTTINHARTIAIPSLAIELGIVQRQLCNSNSHLNFAAHDLAAFANCSLQLLVHGPVIRDITGESSGLGTKISTEHTAGNLTEGSNRTDTVMERLQQGIRVVPQGANDSQSGDDNAVRRAFIHGSRSLRARSGEDLGAGSATPQVRYADHSNQTVDRL